MSKIHLGFYVSQLKKVLGVHHQVMPLPEVLNVQDELVVDPELVLDTRYNDSGVLEALVHWKGLPSHEDSWESVKELQR